MIAVEYDHMQTVDRMKQCVTEITRMILHEGIYRDLHLLPKITVLRQHAQTHLVKTKRRHIFPFAKRMECVTLPGFRPRDIRHIILHTEMTSSLDQFRRKVIQSL